MTKIGDYMSSPVLSVGYDWSVRDTAEFMYSKKIGAVLIKKDDEYAGILTKTDVLHKVIGGFLDYETTKAHEIMTSSIISMDFDKPIFEANEFMQEKKIRHLVITKNGAITGMVSITDLVACYLNLLGIEQ
jgi:signal-transduction protein with cAMP-binding, CBS, and nucleotidyltransferase domain